MRVGIDDNGDALAVRRRQPEGIEPIGQDRNRAAGNRLGGEVPPVKLGPGQGGKKIARPDPAQIGGEAGDLGVERRQRRDRGRAEELSKMQSACLSGSRASAHERLPARNSSIGGTPSSGAMRTMTRPTAGAAVQPAVA